MLRWPILAMLLIQEVYLDSLLDSAAFQELKFFSVSVAVVILDSRKKLNQNPFFVANEKWLISNILNVIIKGWHYKYRSKSVSAYFLFSFWYLYLLKVVHTWQKLGSFFMHVDVHIHTLSLMYYEKGRIQMLPTRFYKVVQLTRFDWFPIFNLLTNKDLN